MAKKEFTYRGKKVEELQELTMEEFMKLLPSRKRRSLKRGLSDDQKKLIEDLKNKDSIKTHIRDMVVLPAWVGKTLKIYNGKEFVAIEVKPEHIGCFTGELALTRAMVKHSAPGVGATRSSTAISARAK